MGMACAKYLKTTQNGADAARQTMPDDAQRRKKTDRRRSVFFLGQHLAAQALVMALDGSRFLPLAFCSRFFIELTRTQLGEQPGLLDGSLERRRATSNGSFSLTRTSGMKKPSLKRCEMGT